MLDPVLTEIATTLAGKAGDRLHDLVRSAFRGHAEAGKELAAVEGAEPGPAPVPALAIRLAEFEAADPDFADRLRAAWAVRADHGGVVNEITGAVIIGRITQATHIDRGITC